MNIIFIDTETTGTSYTDNSVIQIAAEFHINGEKINSFNQKFKPLKGTNVDLGALMVNNTKFRELKEFEDPETITRKFVDFLLECKEKVGKDKLFVCGHSVHFDMQFLTNLLKSQGIEGLENIIHRKYLDTSVLAQGLIAAGKIHPVKDSLKGLAEYFDIVGIEEGDDVLKVVGYHDAAYDISVTAKVYYKILDLLRG